MARLANDAGETCGNVPSPRSDSGNDHAYYGLGTRVVEWSHNDISRTDVTIQFHIALLSQKLFSSRLEWTEVSTSPRSYQHPQRESNRVSAECELDALTTRPHCLERYCVTGQV
ncbi:unnamed protein product [Protopolystoma xenopodis]|uniref:Uncharacterized protein n=1 Tax=Protopolystoma xenopodis TaxID=117903 RepID=A0A3S5CJM9_9PLAT|nr:unnamed protein product [Protopolystoma xenopodis]